MAVLAPAIIDVRPADGTPGIARWLRGIGVRQVRLACGLVMFSYIFSHFFNHALGNFSYDTMEAWLRFHVWWWRIPIVNFTLYAAAATHFSLGLWALYQRRHFRYTAIEITQLVFGLSIPLLIASHLGIMRLGGVWTRPTSLCGSVVRLLGQPPVHDRRAVCSAYRRLDPCLHRALFLAPAKTVFQVGCPVLVGHSRAAAASRHDRYPSRRPRGDRASVATAMAQRTRKNDPARAARHD